MLIDLDTVTWEPVTQHPPRSRLRRQFAVLALLALALSTVGGVERPPKSRIAQIADIAGDPVAGLAMSGTDLFVSTRDEVSAYDVRDGSRRWRLSLALAGNGLYREGDLLLVSGVDRRRADPTVETAAVDVATGTLRWRLEGWVGPFMNNLVPISPMPIRPPEDKHPDNVMRFHRLADGALMWTLNAGQAMIAVAPELDMVATIEPSTGQYAEWNVHEGTVRRRAVLPLDLEVVTFFYNEDVLVLMNDFGKSARFDARSLAALPSGSAQDELRTDCGLVWCDVSHDSLGAVLIDKASGVRKFEDLRWQHTRPTAAGVLGLIFNDSGRLAQALSVFNPLTGVVTDVSGWSLTSLDGHSSGQEPVYLVRNSSSLTHFARLDQDGFHYVGAAAAIRVEQCASGGQYMACQVGSDLVRIWRLT